VQQTAGRKRTRRNAAIPSDNSETLPPKNAPELHYHMADDTRTSHTLRDFITGPGTRDDVAVQVMICALTQQVDKMLASMQGFDRMLCSHVLTRLQGLQSTGDEIEYTADQLRLVSIKSNRIYEHSTCRILYTTYDNRRASDTINPHSHADIMLQADSENTSEPYFFGRVIGIYHANVALASEEHERMDFLHVRWLGSPANGGRARRLPSVGFYDRNLSDDFQYAFGLVDPNCVIRGIHLLPVFTGTHPKTEDLLGSGEPSIARRHNHRTDRSQWTWDWAWFYVNM
jgi:hypothetical protein